MLAKKNGIHVEEFSIGMGPRLFSKVAGDTRYSIKLLPIGGSCMMGEDDVEDMSEEVLTQSLSGQEFLLLQPDRFLILYWHLFLR